MRADIIAKRFLRFGPWPVVGVAAAVCGALLRAGATATDVLAYQRSAVLQGAWWRLVTCNFVHLGGWHCALNVATLAAWAVLCPEPAPLRVWVLRWAVLCAAVGVGLLVFAPGIERYVGLSGVTYGLLFLGLGRQALEGQRLSQACLAFLAVRIAIEFIPGTTGFEERLIGGKVISASHVFGAGGAALYAAAGWILRWRADPARSG